MIIPALEKARGQPGDALDNAIKANVARVVAQLKTSQPILAKLVKEGCLTVVGARYDLDDGKVTFEWTGSIPREMFRRTGWRSRRLNANAKPIENEHGQHTNRPGRQDSRHDPSGGRLFKALGLNLLCGVLFRSRGASN